VARPDRIRHDSQAEAGSHPRLAEVLGEAADRPAHEPSSSIAGSFARRHGFAFWSGSLNRQLSGQVVSPAIQVTNREPESASHALVGRRLVSPAIQPTNGEGDSAGQTPAVGPLVSPAIHGLSAGLLAA